ncbi:hypothetical protein [Bdellovibrio svalbardensis]|uniref:Transglycosylase SLT domain-containing protein n=1 Tax=Bdellovibrio svalbardensis TaxID=2972972 RepID=A0ABT6DP46_9BACT|nr:hypothetical protein [Bdellovibrio svalbardensis]MDG0817606.1 hypothetical protein [Bdellovibrio svalbardensis]
MMRTFKHLLIAIVCLLPFGTQANNRSLVTDGSVRSVQFEATAPCLNCSTQENKTEKSARDLRNTLTAQATAEQISAISEKMNWGDACENFTYDDEFGKWATMIMKELKSNEAEALLRGSDDLLRLCPGYKSLKLEGRQNVWVLIFNAMAFYESTCDKDSKAKGPNGSLIGLLQLHRGKEQAYAPNCKKGDGNTPAGTFRCAISMLNSQLERGENLFSRKSYWDVLRPQARSKKYAKIQKAIKSFPLCH